MILPDANLLLYAYDTGSPFHKGAARWLKGLLSGSEPVGFCPVVLFSFLRLATNPRVFEQPMSVTEATTRIQGWLDRPNVRVLYPGPEHMEGVFVLLKAAGTAGNLVSDAQIAALAIEYRATIHSADTDFARFKGVDWVNPLLET
jgi:toxin-antitoxin system PIN domain toxin